ncbi:MAG: hypothetical protein CVU42_16080 [Chloroflexi bacterium HGW-Chloroflexi-4]|jgi:hypothetical protein|nr:MAG: hypothetical protein CVU42_16080 [Chloroflexi bacterium HGW-Chloroflexi-4]
MTQLTLFTAPKPFTNPHIALIQRNAIRSWLQLGSEVEVLLLGDEEGMTEEAEQLGVCHIKEIKRNVSGTPLISSLFDAGRQQNSSSILAYVNTDILLFPDFLSTAQATLAQTKRFLLVGQRWDLEVTRELDFSAGWQERLKQECAEKGSLHKPTGSDYFIYPRECFDSIPDFAIGRAGWDNWMIYQSRLKGWKTIDASSEIQIIHQNHDYSHLPGGQAHYHLPETDENIRLAGGRRTIFNLPDASFVIHQGQIKPARWSGKRLLREIEIFPLITFKSYFLAEIMHLILHPRKLWAAIRARFTGRNSKQE